MDKPLVSVIVATYNENPKIIEAAIQSILNQTYERFELLIYDDSTDETTQAVIDKLAGDHRVYVFRQDERLGFVKSLNCGLRAAKGKYIARMDGDDISLPDRLEKEIRFLESNPDISVVGGQMDIINEDGDIISHRQYPQSGIRLFLFSCMRNPLAHPTVMMRRDIVDKGYLYDESLGMSEDLDLWLRVMNDGYRIANISDTVLNYRVTENFTEKRTSRAQVEYMSNVRKTNFYRRRSLHGVLSCFSAWMFTHVSVDLLQDIYNRENNR